MSFFDDPFGETVEFVADPTGGWLSDPLGIFDSVYPSAPQVKGPLQNLGFLNFVRKNNPTALIPPPLNLKQFPGYNPNSDLNVDLPSEYYDLIKPRMAEVLNSEKYQQLLSGDPDMALFNRAVTIPFEQELQNRLLPQLNAEFGAGPHGRSYFSGARETATKDVMFDTYSRIAQLRLEYGDRAVQNMIAASGLLQQFATTYRAEREVEVDNLNRQINVHFANQGLVAQEYASEVQRSQMALSIFEGALNVWMGQIDLNNQQQVFDYQSDLQNLQTTLSLINTGASVATSAALLGAGGGTAAPATAAGAVGSSTFDTELDNLTSLSLGPSASYIPTGTTSMSTFGTEYIDPVFGTSDVILDPTASLYLGYGG